MSQIGFQAGLRAGMRNATATRSLVGAAITLGVVTVISIAEKQLGVLGAANRALEDRIFGLVLPFALLYMSRRILEPARLDDAASAIARFGFSRRSVGLGMIVASMMAGAALAAAAAAETAILAHDSAAPAPALDALTCAWIGALTGCAYAGLFALGATFGARGGGRFWALSLDFILSATGSFAALLVPHAHAQNLLGGEPPLLLTQSASAAMLVALAGGYTALALARSAR